VAASCGDAGVCVGEGWSDDGGDGVAHVATAGSLARHGRPDALGGGRLVEAVDAGLVG
jgi:hypothetical protein